MVPPGPCHRSYREAGKLPPLLSLGILGAEITVFTPISFEDYVRRHLGANPGEDKAEFQRRLRDAVDAKRAGQRCDCGEPIWAIGSAVSHYACFTCITGEANASEDYEIDEALETRGTVRWLEAEG